MFFTSRIGESGIVVRQRRILHHYRTIHAITKLRYTLYHFSVASISNVKSFETNKYAKIIPRSIARSYDQTLRKRPSTRDRAPQSAAEGITLPLNMSESAWRVKTVGAEVAEPVESLAGQFSLGHT